jgi:hypothetical protein
MLTPGQSRAGRDALTFDQAGKRGADPVPGMNSGLSPSDPTLVAAFGSALLHLG